MKNLSRRHDFQPLGNFALYIKQMFLKSCDGMNYELKGETLKSTGAK